MTENTATAARRVALLVLAVLACTAIATTVVVFFASGLKLFMIETPSMGTTDPVGSLLAVHAQSAYHVGDIVSFTMDGRVITHRLVGYAAGVFTTKGDLNGSPDGWQLHQSAIIGKVMWSAPGLGWVLKGLPWLVLGAIVTELIARMRVMRRAWRWPIRLTGWAVTVTLVGLWLRPWFNVQLLDFRAADRGGGVLMHIVNTGLFPLKAASSRIVSGQDAVVHVTDKLPSGAYFLSPTPDVDWPLRVAIIFVCLVPLIVALLIRQAEEGLLFEESAEAATEARSRRVVILVIAVVAAIVVTVMTSITVGSGAAFAASVKNSSGSAGTNSFFTCKAAQTSLGASSTYAAYAMGTTSSPKTETDLSGNGRTGSYAAATTVSSTYGCTRDTPLASMTFNGTSQCLYVPGAVANPNVFSLEAWFKTSNTSNGKIIGFGTANGSAADTQYDRHIYIDPAGRVVFGVYPNTVVTIATTGSYADGKWHDVIATLSSAGMALYVDGALASLNTTYTTGEAYTGYWRIGCGNLGAWANGAGVGDTSYSGPSYFTGQIQYAAIYNVALTAAQAKAHYLAGP